MAVSSKSITVANFFRWWRLLRLQRWIHLRSRFLIHRIIWIKLIFLRQIFKRWLIQRIKSGRIQFYRSSWLQIWRCPSVLRIIIRWSKLRLICCLWLIFLILQRWRLIEIRLRFFCWSSLRFRQQFFLRCSRLRFRCWRIWWWGILWCRIFRNIFFVRWHLLWLRVRVWRRILIFWQRQSIQGLIFYSVHTYYLIHD